jgi:hypothetical protein
MGVFFSLDSDFWIRVLCPRNSSEDVKDIDTFSLSIRVMAGVFSGSG